MTASLHALLARLIDYAGLFPPARLPLDQAIRNYADYRAGPDAWMLGRFICPAARLAELSPFVTELFGTGPPLTISALGRGGKNADEFLTGLAADLDAISNFRRQHGDRASVDVFEVRIPPEMRRNRSHANVNPFVQSVQREMERCGGLRPFFEPEFSPDWRTELRPTFASLAEGMKIRCGGLEPAAFPTGEQLAFALVTCRDLGIPFKATAGLHHPFRRWDADLKVTMHGFVNVLAAGVLAHAHGLREDRVKQIIEDGEAGHFAFGDSEFRWQDLRAATAETRSARENFVISFGSCSFDEPREDLRALGWL